MTAFINRNGITIKYHSNLNKSDWRGIFYWYFHCLLWHPASKMKRNLPLQKFNFLFHVYENGSKYLSVAPTLCWPNGPFHQPTVPTDCSLDGLFNLIEVAAALAGTVKGIRFIFLYFVIFYIDLHFYICFSL